MSYSTGHPPRPEPVQKNVTINVPQNVSTLTLEANFSGSTDTTRWMVIWSNSSTPNLGNYDGKYRTEHQVVSDCLFTGKLIIHNVSMSDAGLYFAKVNESLDTGVNFTVNIVIQGYQKRKIDRVSISVWVSMAISVVLLIAVLLLVVRGGIMRIKQCQKKRGRHSES